MFRDLRFPIYKYIYFHCQARSLNTSSQSYNPPSTGSRIFKLLPTSSRRIPALNATSAHTPRARGRKDAVAASGAASEPNPSLLARLPAAGVAGPNMPELQEPGLVQRCANKANRPIRSWPIRRWAGLRRGGAGLRAAGRGRRAEHLLFPPAALAAATLPGRCAGGAAALRELLLFDRARRCAVPLGSCQFVWLPLGP